MSKEDLFEPLKSYLAKVPAISDISTGFSGDGYWWVKFTIDIEHPLAWSVVQESWQHVLNYVSLEERLPALFMPVSPPPYMNGGPRDFLSWVIESKSKDFKPEKCAEWLEGRLPQPVTDIEKVAHYRFEELIRPKLVLDRSFSGNYVEISPFHQFDSKSANSY